MIDSVLSSFVFVIKEIFKCSHSVAGKNTLQMFEYYSQFLNVTKERGGESFLPGMSSDFDNNKTWRYVEDRCDISGIRFLVQNLFGPECLLFKFYLVLYICKGM